jgi:hypothetical protein
MEKSDLIAFSNRFGEVHADRITFNVRKSWFAGSIREDIPSKHITTVRIETKRSVVIGVILILIGLVFINGIIGWLALVLGVFFLLGAPTVTIFTAGGDSRSSQGNPFQGSEGESFASAVRASIFKS